MTSGKKCLLVLAVLAAILATSGNLLASTEQGEPKAKYIFLFIGDGMGITQRYAAELYLAKQKGLSRAENAKLVMNTLPAQGLNTTYDLTSVIPDSASTGTAIACGHKTRSGVIGMDAEAKVSYESIAERAKKMNRKVGILSTVFLNDATPAVFYAHVPSRKQMYDISMQLAYSGFDYFAGGQLKESTDKNDPSKPNALETAKKNGYTVVPGRAGFEALKPGEGKVIAMSATIDKHAAMYYTLDQTRSTDNVTIAEYLDKAIELLDNPNGFFIMVEGGKIDWACHANDAAAAIHDVLALDEAVARAVNFLKKHPEETLIVVTADHETGGMTIGFSGTQYSSQVERLQHQKMSYIEFGKELDQYKKTHARADAELEDIMPLIKEAFGLYVMPGEEKESLQKIVSDGKAKNASPAAKKAAKDASDKLENSMALNDRELKILEDAFKQSMSNEKERAKDHDAYLLYGGFEPLTVKLTTILNNKAGIGWTSYAHTGVPVQISAIGVGAEQFNGYYDQTDIYTKMMKIAGFSR
jgi:alkaline phosphatase